jgi:Spy/CpxP family protein refolding chaperone
MISGRMRFVGVAAILLLCGAAAAQPATQPTFGGGTRGTRGRGDMLFQRLRGAMDDLKLTDDQRSKIEDIFTKAQEDMHELAPTLQNLDQQDRRIHDGSASEDR